MISQLAQRITTTIFASLALCLSQGLAAQAPTAPSALKAVEAAAVKGGASAKAAQSLAKAATKTLTERFEITTPEVYGAFGTSISLSGDRALIGAPHNSGGGTYAGAAYTFVYDGTTWVEEAKLTASDAFPGDQFGYSVALEGTRAVIGAYNKTVSNLHKGGAYVFDFDGTTWHQSAILLARDGKPSDALGSSVSISGDRVLVGAPGKLRYRGAAYVFVFDGTNWVTQTSLTLPDAVEGDEFGDAVSISGARALVGAYFRDTDVDASGAAYTYAFDGTTWNQEAELIPSDPIFDGYFGYSVSLDGNGAVVGARNALDDKGAAYVFTFDGTTWTQAAELSASDGAAGDEFGTSVAIAGNRVLVGADQHYNYPMPGAAYIYKNSHGTWAEQFKLIASDGMASDFLGISVSLSGKRALVGAQNGAVKEAAYVFGR